MMMTRFGPLHAINGDLVVGDPTRNHLVLRVGAVDVRCDSEVVATYEWDDVQSVDLRVQRTRFRFPGAISAASLAVLTLVVQDDASFHVADGSVVITSRDVAYEHPLSKHHLGGYWTGSVSATQRLLDRLIDHKPSRSTLAQPEALVNSVARAIRRRTLLPPASA